MRSHFLIGGFILFGLVGCEGLRAQEKEDPRFVVVKNPRTIGFQVESDRVLTIALGCEGQVNERVTSHIVFRGDMIGTFELSKAGQMCVYEKGMVLVSLLDDRSGEPLATLPLEFDRNRDYLVKVSESEENEFRAQIVEWTEPVGEGATLSRRFPEVD